VMFFSSADNANATSNRCPSCLINPENDSHS
jgi:hypothetical protein